MSTHGRKKRAREPKFHPLAFGGWPDYQQWADNDFRPCPEPPSQPEPEPEPTPQPRTERIATTMWAGVPVVEPAAPEPEPEPLSPPGWQAFAEVEPEPDPAVWEAFTAVDMQPVTPRPVPVTTRQQEGADTAAQWADDDLVVRPYIRTHGRVSQGYDLRLETLVSVTGLHERDPVNPAFTQDMLSICDLCRAAPQSVAEVSSYLDAPVGVTRVLIADAVEAGLVTVEHGAALVDARPSRELLERIRDGLRDLV
ncbi:DUF742 domain-containing protein [Umezawaea sp.]|uniref:DUF742 domain-containing protein n=1 Tax=Umezawaea sp. TaxID=1955258 RepID=UPI002ED0ED61